MKHDFFQVTARVVPQSYPTTSNAITWKEQNASKPLPPRTRQHVDFTSLQYITDEASVVANKKCKFVVTGADRDAIELVSGTSCTCTTRGLVYSIVG